MKAGFGEKRTAVLTTIDLTTHLVLAVLLAGFFRWFTGGWTWPVLAFIGGVLIDLDHLIDHFRYYGMKFDISDFFYHRYLASGKCYIFFHSWEVIAVLWMFSSTVPLATPLATGMTLHILTDYAFCHNVRFLHFSLLYRWSHRFNLGEMCACAPEKVKSF